MKNFNIITGMPRSGSTLLCNILSQNPDFYAGATSPLPEILGIMINKFSNSIEIQGAMTIDKTGTTEKLNRMLMGVIDAWYADQDGVVFDKSRGWSFYANMLNDLYEDIKIIVTVRDLRGVFGSVEKQHRKTPMFDLANTPTEKTILNRADVMFANDGMIGQCAVGLQDLMARSASNVYVLNFEAFTVDPSTKIKEIYNFLGIDHFDHDFVNIENVSNEPDAQWLHKFPHLGEGEVKPTDRKQWKDYLTPDMGQTIHNLYPKYNELFGYQ